MRIAETLDDLPVGTQVQIWLESGVRYCDIIEMHKGIVYHSFNPQEKYDEHGCSWDEYSHVKILLSNGTTKLYLGDDVEFLHRAGYKEIRIVEAKCE